MRPSNDDLQSLSSHMFWTLLLQGIWFILFGVLIIAFPPLLFILAAASFFAVGLTLVIVAWRIRRLSQGVAPATAPRV
jgi:ABC-type bacteriocin/lantibiotic exporter with double-glycine peptidase domain